MSAPMRKLQDLLSTAPSNQRETAKLPILGNKSFQNVPMEPCAIPSNQGNLGSVNFPFKNLQRNQNLFYYPLMKPNDNCYPSPMVQLTNLQAVRTNNAMFFPQSQVELDNQANIYGSNMNSEILNSLSALEGSKMSIFSQPKNLNELLQKSLLSTYSTSLSQSPFVSSNQSPHVGYNMINNSGFQASINPDYSNLLTASVLGTPVQSQPLRPQNVVPQVSQMSNEGLLLQLENLLKQENARGIKLALAGLIHQFNEGKNNNQSRDNMTLPRMQEELSQHGNQRAIPLSNGFLMNRVNRTNETNMRGLVGNNRIGAREMMMMNEASSRKKNYSIIPEEDSTGDISFNQIKHSPNQNLNQKMNSLNLNVETQDIPKHNNLNISSLPVDEELNAILEERLPHDGGAPGTYNREERTGKILKYKNKIRKWRTEHPVNRNFKGRSVVAGKKPRIKGKFVTIEEYVEYIKTTKHNEEGLQVNEPFNESTTYAESEKSNREHDLNIKEENIY